MLLRVYLWTGYIRIAQLDNPRNDLISNTLVELLIALRSELWQQEWLVTRMVVILLC